MLKCPVCRIDNLVVVPSTLVSSWCQHTHHNTELHSTDSKEGARPDQQMSLYFMAMQQLPFDPADEYVESLVLRYYDQHGQLVEEEDDSQCYYECRSVLHYRDLEIHIEIPDYYQR